MTQEIGAIITFGVLAALSFSLCWQRGFFRLIPFDVAVPVKLLHVVGAFFIYFFFATSVSLFVVHFLKDRLYGNYLGYSSWVNFSVSFLIFCALLIYVYCLPQNVRRGILLRDPNPHSFKEDLFSAFYAWIASFPLVLAFSQLLELILLTVFKIPQLPDQIAVLFLKSTFQTPLYFFLAILSITVFAPLIEETLFRGFLQTYIRRHLGPKQAIVITSACFSLFHYSAGQGVGNISIILSLFILALFLGFLYEKRGSIAAPMILHASFNSISVINLYLFGGFTNSL